AGLINLRLTVVLESATALGAVAGILMIGMVPESVLYGIFAVVLLVSAVQMFTGRRARSPVGVSTGHLSLDAAYTDHDGSIVAYGVSRLPLGMTFMFGAGTLSALLGIGSGGPKIPAMDAGTRLPVKGDR